MNAALARRTLEQRHGHPPQYPQVRPAITARAVVVLAEHHVQHPVQAVLDPPVPAHQAPQSLRPAAVAADVQLQLATVLALHLPLPADGHQRLDVHPLRGQPDRVVDHRHIPLLVATVSLLQARKRVMAQAREVTLEGLEQQPLAGLLQRRLVALDRQQVIAPLLPNLLGYVHLAAGRVDGDQGPFQVEDAEQLRDSGDLVGAFFHLLLTQDQVVGHRPGADQVQATAGRGLGTAAGGLAVDGNGLEPAGRAQGRHPAAEAGSELAGVQGGEDAAEGVVGGDAVGQGQEAPEPVVLGMAEGLDVGPGLGPADDGAQGEDEDVAQGVQLGAIEAGVRQVGEVVDQGQLGRCHGGSSGCPSWSSGPATKSCNKLRAAVMLRAGPSRRLPHAWPKTYPVDHPGGGSADPGGRRSQSPLVLVPGAACPHRPGRRRRGACRRGRLPAGVRSGHRLAHLPALRAGRADQTPAGRPPPGAPAGDFPPSSAPRSSNSPAWSPSPRGCTSRTGPARTWPARPSRTGSLKPSAPPWSVASSRRWTSSRTARATGAQRGWTSGSRSGPRRSSGATGMRSGWPAGAFGSSAPTRSPTCRCWSETRSAGPSPATSSSRSSSIPGTAPSTCCCSWWSTPARWS